MAEATLLVAKADAVILVVDPRIFNFELLEQGLRNCVRRARCRWHRAEPGAATEDAIDLPVRPVTSGRRGPESHCQGQRRCGQPPPSIRLVLQKPEIGPEETSGSKPKKATDRRNVVTNYICAIVIVGWGSSPLRSSRTDWGSSVTELGARMAHPFPRAPRARGTSTAVAFVSRHLELGDDEKVGASLNTSSS